VAMGFRSKDSNE